MQAGSNHRQICLAVPVSTQIRKVVSVISHQEVTSNSFTQICTDTKLACTIRLFFLIFFLSYCLPVKKKKEHFFQ